MTTTFQHYLTDVAVGAYVAGTTAGTGDNTTTGASIAGGGATNVVADAPAGTPLNRAFKITQGSGNVATVYKTITTATTLFHRGFFKMEGPLVTSANHTFFRVGSGATRGLDLLEVGTGRYRLFDAAGGTVAETATGVAIADTWIRYELTLSRTAVTMGLYLGNTDTVVGTVMSASGLPDTTFGSSWDRITWGNTSTTPVSEPLLVAGLLVDDTTTPGKFVTANTGWHLGAIAM